MSEAQNTLALIERVDIFHEVPTPILEELLDAADERTYEKGAEVFHEGDAGTGMYLVVSGAVELTQATKPGQEQRLALMDRGQIFGELSLFDELPRSATAVAFVNSELLHLPTAAVDRLLNDQHALAPLLLRNLVKKLSLRLRDADNEIRALSLSRVP